MNFKGQYFSFDAIIAAVIFILALVALLSYWHSVKSYLDYQNDPLSKEAIRVSNLLFTPPYPSSDCASMSRLGFSVSQDDRRLGLSIIGCAQAKAASNQSWLQDRLATPYKVSITFTKLTDSPLVVATVGGPVPSDANEVANMRRLATVVNETSGETYLAAVDLSMYD